MPSTIIMTGCQGDIGSLLIPLLAQHDIIVYPLEEITGIHANRLLHLAARSFPATANEFIQSNILYLQNVVQLARKNKIKEIIFFSAMSVYGNPDKEDLDENTPLSAPNIYGVSKLWGEEFLKQSELTVLCLRLPAILGMTNTTNLPARFYINLKNNQDIIISNPNRLYNNFIPVENLGQFLAQVELKKKFDIINLAVKKELTLADMVRLMKDSMPSTSQVILSDHPGHFFNIATHKAQQDYGFLPGPSATSLTRWLNQRMEFEKRTVTQLLSRGK